MYRVKLNQSMNKAFLSLSFIYTCINRMSHLTDFQREVIVMFKREQPTWGLEKCRQILPGFFGNISKNQLDRVYRNLRSDGSPVARRRRTGSGTAIRVSTSPVRDAVVDLAVTPPDKSRRHFSQREIASELSISKGTVSTILANSGLKCYRRIQCHKLNEIHCEARVEKAEAFINRFDESNEWKNIWFSDEAHFSLHTPLNRQNERIYREVTLKTNIPAEDLIIQHDKQQPSLLCYAAVSWYGKSELRFIDGFAENQDNIPASRRKKKTVNQFVYTQEMCPLMFDDINRTMNGRPWVWQQDGAKAHTARTSTQWIRENAPDFITPDEWPSKSPDLNVMDYSLWGILLAGLAHKRREIDSMEKLKAILTEAWNNIPMDIIQRATASWIPRLRACIHNGGGHFEHLL